MLSQRINSFAFGEEVIQGTIVAFQNMLHTLLPERYLSEGCVGKIHACLKLSVVFMLSSLLCLLTMLLWTWWLQLVYNSNLIISSAKTITDLGYQSLDKSSASTHLKIHFKIFESSSPKKEVPGINNHCSLRLLCLLSFSFIMTLSDLL